MLKSTLALLYFPQSSSPRIARQHLMRWVKNARGLQAELADLGYQKYQKRLSTEQRKIIEDYLGEP